MIDYLNLRSIKIEEKIKALKAAARPVLTILFAIAFLLYFKEHREDFKILLAINPGLLFIVVLGQTIVFLSNVGMLVVIVHQAKKPFSKTEAIKVTVYSSVVNFFGFLQAGLGYRGVYLKRKHNIPYKLYSVMTIMQYIILFAVSSTIGIYAYLAVNTHRPNSITLPVLIVILLLLAAIFKYSEKAKSKYYKLKKIFSLGFSRQSLIYMTLLVILQYFGLAIAFGAELIIVGADFSISALLMYTSIVNFSLLFAITPGAIGIRETMLLIVANQMHLGVNDIILSSTIDRIIYFIILLTITPIALSWKKKNRNLHK